MQGLALSHNNIKSTLVISNINWPDGLNLNQCENVYDKLIQLKGYD